MFTRLKILVVIALLVAVTLPSTAIAQEGGGPERTGLRPDAPPYALHGPYWVGTMEFRGETPSHPTEITVWYPALNTNGTQEEVDYLPWYFPPITGRAIRNATPDVGNGPFPFVIAVHGWQSHRFSTQYLSEHLSSQGFVVMAIDYADHIGAAATVPQYTTLYTHPEDISWQIDFAGELTDADGALEGMIDMERIAVVGHSHGGWAAVAAAGGQLEMDWLREIADVPRTCVNLLDESGVNWCIDIVDHEQELAELAGLDAVPSGLWPSWGDPRIDTIVGLAPAAGYFGPQGLTRVQVPAMFLVGSADSIISLEVDVRQVFNSLQSGQRLLLTLAGGDHVLFCMSCEDAPWLVQQGYFWACSDPVWDMDRAHDLINHFVTAFLLAELYGDEDAAAALSPDAVQFPGITYETTGF